MVMAGLIPVDLWLKNSSLPFAKSILKDFDEIRAAGSSG
jgi:hypothetical protein